MSGRSGGHFSAVCYWHTCTSRGKATTLFRLPVHASRHLQAPAGWMRHSACILMQRTGGRAVRGALTCFVYIFTGQRTTFKRLDPLLKLNRVHQERGEIFEQTTPAMRSGDMAATIPRRPTWALHGLWAQARPATRSHAVV